MINPNVMPKPERLRWLLIAILAQGNNGGTDVLDRAFVDAYLLATKAPHQTMIIGAHKCKMLGADLGELYKKAHLTRFTVGVPGAGPGFPTWVFAYKLTMIGQKEAEMLKAAKETHDAANV